MTDQSDLFEYAPKHDSEELTVKPAGRLKIEDPHANRFEASPEMAGLAGDFISTVIAGGRAWADIAFFVASNLALSRETFTARDIRAAMPENAAAHEHQAMDGVMKRLKDEGIAWPTSRVEPDDSEKPGGPAKVWRSLLFSAGAAGAGGANDPETTE